MVTTATELTDLLGQIALILQVLAVLVQFTSLDKFYLLPLIPNNQGNYYSIIFFLFKQLFYINLDRSHRYFTLSQRLGNIFYTQNGYTD